MRHNHRTIAIILVFWAMSSILLMASVSAAGSSPSLLPAANFSPSRMEVGVFINSINNLDFVKGTYSMDFYLHFRWTDPSIQTAHFELMNGKQSSGSNSLEKVSENKSGPVKEEWYRVRGDFAITPNIRDYPFESGTAPIKIEDAERDEDQLIYVPIGTDSGIDPQFVIPGWTIGTPAFSVVDHAYPWGETYSQLSFNVPLTKNPADSVIQTLIPPVIFCIIAMISFFIVMDHPVLVSLRYIITTSMFMSAVMYQFSQLSMLPGIGALRLFDKFMIAVYLFLSATIIVTTLCYLAQRKWKRPGLVEPINRYGLVVSILLPIVSFLLLVTQM